MDKLTKWLFDVFLILITVIANFTARNQGCLLKRRPEPSRGGLLRWSLPYVEICACQLVVAPIRSTSVCSGNDYAEDELWFIDNPQALAMRQNWEKDKLDELLERRDYCADECQDGTATCDDNALCTDTLGSFTCHCNTGYSGDGLTCIDVNECADDTDTCAANANCTNTDGSYTCQCHAGYIGNGNNCTDVNECADDTDTCAVYAYCTNTDGSYTCQCRAGFIGDGYNNCTAGILGMEDGTITDEQITASSAPNTDNPAYDGRLMNSIFYGFWHSDNAANDPNPWIQVDFLTPVYIVGIITQGGCTVNFSLRCSNSGWVYTVEIQTGNVVSTLTYISENGNTVVFDANIDADDINDQAVIMFPETIEARYIRIHPVSYKWDAHVGPGSIFASAAMRLEILGATPI